MNYWASKHKEIIGLTFRSVMYPAKVIITVLRIRGKDTHYIGNTITGFTEGKIYTEYFLSRRKTTVLPKSEVPKELQQYDKRFR